MKLLCIAYISVLEILYKIIDRFYEKSEYFDINILFDI